jgi:hypothetical protein
MTLNAPAKWQVRYFGSLCMGSFHPPAEEAARPKIVPDALCRRKLFELYGEGLTLDVKEPDRFIGRTEGASPAFIRELLRKAALFAAEESADSITVRDEHLDEALRELVIIGGPLTRALLGAVISSEDRE